MRIGLRQKMIFTSLLFSIMVTLVSAGFFVRPAGYFMYQIALKNQSAQTPAVYHSKLVTFKNQREKGVNARQLTAWEKPAGAVMELIKNSPVEPGVFYRAESFPGYSVLSPAPPLLTMIIFTLTFILTLGYSNYIISPILIINQNVHDIIAGRSAAPMLFKKNDEFGELARGFNTLSENISENKNKMKAMQQELNLIDKICSNSNEGIVITDGTTRVTRVNRSFTRIMGYTAAEVLGKRMSQICQGWNNDEVYETIWSSLIEKDIWQGELWDIKKNGDDAVILQSIIALKDDQNIVSNYIGIYQDVTDKKKNEEKVEQLAYFDLLTGLPNRTLFYDRLKQNLDYSSRNNLHLALLFIDVDNFKKVNDTFGHQYGDRLLKTVAARLNSVLRKSDTNSRLGGDEFTIILYDIKDSSEAGQIAQRCIQMISQPIMLDDEEFFMTLSVGISFYPDDGTDAQTLLMKADTAMNHAKEKGKNNFQFYTDKMNHEANEKLKMETYLHNALKNHEFFIYYQPQIDNTSGEVIGVEALIRWKNPKGEFISPVSFIPVAEKTGMILEIGNWVFENACRFCRHLENTMHKKIKVAVNFSIRQLKDAEFVENIKRIIEKTHVSTELIEIEITESLFMEDIENHIEKLAQLRAMGITIAIDDFGTGYSSMNYLCKIPLDKLKIDKSFVDQILNKDSKTEVIQAMIGLAHNLSLKVIAEGVETQEQVTFLKENQCNEYQGFYFAKPMPEEELIKLIQSGKNFLAEKAG